MGTLQLVVTSCFPIPALPSPGELLLSISITMSKYIHIWRKNTKTRVLTPNINNSQENEILYTHFETLEYRKSE